ncbi:lipopolysaccharide biosynthesis protein [Bacillus weihaiensis]|uniref:Uncharacterized protein n=1 Tax=Bacillus weihaiensis TaxID=1547283 RepID=A0A1L3MMJ6_9BACI|nr:lipopolysaccharide biosynthesis protein [Bacillus weihaiensis]APH03557.1 hypothetical protein A9C19_01640 [Bacillus weihaiensis]
MSFFKNSLWSFINVTGMQMIAILTNIVLARILYPEIFGVLGMAMVFTGFVIIFQEAGLSSYIIYEKKLTKSIISTSFWLNIILSSLLFLLMYILAKPISIFYETPEVAVVIKYIAIGLFLGSFGITSKALLMKEKKFSYTASVDLIAELVASVFSILLAIKGYELLAISTRFIIRPTLQSIIYLVIKGKQVLGGFSIDSLKIIFPYSWKVLGTQTFSYINNNIDYLMIGKLLGSVSLGFYTIAFQWSILARFYISGALSKVAFAEIATIQNDISKVRHLYLYLLKQVSFLTLPICIGLVVVSTEFITVVYGMEWERSIPVLQILLISGAITSLGALGGPVIRGLGKPEIEMKLTMFSLVLFVIFVYIGSFYGLIGIAFAELIRVLIVDSIKLRIIKNMIGTSYKSIFYSFSKNLISTIVMSIIVVFVASLLNINPIVDLVILILIGVTIYILMTFLINREMMDWVIKKAKSILKR